MPEKDISSIFVDNLRRLLAENNMTYKDLAERIGVKASSVSMWMTGNSLPRMGTLDIIADLFNVSVESLVTGKEEYNKYSYINEDTAKTVRELFENKELRMLFDAAKDADPEDLKTVHSMLLALKRKEQAAERSMNVIASSFQDGHIRIVKKENSNTNRPEHEKLTSQPYVDNAKTTDIDKHTQD